MSNRTNFIFDCLIADAERTLNYCVMMMRYKYALKIQDKNHRFPYSSSYNVPVAKWGPCNPNSWGQLCSICSSQRKNQQRWTIYNPYLRGDFMTYCVCPDCYQKVSQYPKKDMMSFVPKSNNKLREIFWELY
jgi:hypothetical protein